MHNRLHKIGYMAYLLVGVIFLISLLCYCTDITPLNEVRENVINDQHRLFFDFNKEVFNFSLVAFVMIPLLYLFEVLRKDYLNLAGLVASSVTVVTSLGLSIYTIVNCISNIDYYWGMDFDAFNVSLQLKNRSYTPNDIFLHIPIYTSIVLIVFSLVFLAGTIYKYEMIRRIYKDETSA